MFLGSGDCAIYSSPGIFPPPLPTVVILHIFLLSVYSTRPYAEFAFPSKLKLYPFRNLCVPSRAELRDGMYISVVYFVYRLFMLFRKVNIIYKFIAIVYTVIRDFYSFFFVDSSLVIRIDIGYVFASRIYRSMMLSL